jgi:hypothetical protein
MNMVIYQHGYDIPKDISCVYYAVAHSVEKQTPFNGRYLCKVGMSSNPFNRNKTLKYTHIIHCFDIGKYGLYLEKEREFVEKYIQAKIVKHKIAMPDVWGGDHFSFTSLSTHEYLLKHFDAWALEAIKMYKAI